MPNVVFILSDQHRADTLEPVRINDLEEDPEEFVNLCGADHHDLVAQEVVDDIVRPWLEKTPPQTWMASRKQNPSRQWPVQPIRDWTRQLSSYRYSTAVAAWKESA
jgi:hypothetical protein